MSDLASTNTDLESLQEPLLKEHNWDSLEIFKRHDTEPLSDLLYEFVPHLHERTNNKNEISRHTKSEDPTTKKRPTSNTPTKLHPIIIIKSAPHHHIKNRRKTHPPPILIPPRKHLLPTNTSSSSSRTHNILNLLPTQLPRSLTTRIQIRITLAVVKVDAIFPEEVFSLLFVVCVDGGWGMVDGDTSRRGCLSSNFGRFERFR